MARRADRHPPPRRRLEADERVDSIQTSSRHATLNTQHPIYTTCLYCHHDLGRNETIELFPVGRRLAFDQAKGRLWVICEHCSRWNLTPIEERWEAIEACEKAYRDARKRVATEQIGLAKVTDGLALVRIGSPVFPEYASWRYGERFSNRRLRYLAGASLAAVGGLIVFFGGPMAVGTGGIMGWMMYNGYNTLRTRNRQGRVLGVLETGGARTRVIRGKDAEGARLVIEEPGKVRVEVEPVQVENQRKAKRFPTLYAVQGENVGKFLRIAMPHVNRKGGTADQVKQGVEWMQLGQGGGDPLAVAHQVLGRLGYSSSMLHTLPPPLGLGYEMAVVEGQERRWLEMELDLLAVAWKEAEDLAAVADSLTLPDWIEGKLEDLRPVP